MKAIAGCIAGNIYVKTFLWFSMLQKSLLSPFLLKIKPCISTQNLTLKNIFREKIKALIYLEINKSNKNLIQVQNG